MKRDLLRLLCLLLAGGFALVNSGLAATEGELRQAMADLRHADPDVSRRARLELLRPENFAHVPAQGAEILRAIPTVTSEEDALLLGAVELPPDRRQAVLDSALTPDKVRARLGDAPARDRVIARLESAASLVAVRKAALDLLYVNDASSLAAFVKRLESKEIVEDPQGNKTSVAVLLIQAYGEMHPEAPDFAPATYLNHANVSAEQFRGSTHQGYLRRIEKHFKARHQLEVHLDPPILLDTGKVEVRRARANQP